MACTPNKRKKLGLIVWDEKTEVKRAKKKFANNVDYISELPDPVLHHILSLLHPKDAARTCILSKRWKHAWKSYQILDFDLRRFHMMKKASKEKYKNSMNQLLKCRKEQSLDIFKFRMRFAVAKELLHDVEGWLSAVVESNVRQLEIQARSLGSCQFRLPSFVMSGSSITALNLYGIILPNSATDVNLPHLQKLSLKRINTPLMFTQTVLSSCPLIDELRLIGCTGFKQLNIGTNNKLRRLDVHKCDGLRSIVIDNPVLESFWFFHDKKKLCQINSSGCRGLKDLVLEYPRMKDETFIDTPVFPMLEKLILSRCYGLKEIEVSGAKLKKLVIRRCRKLVKVRVEAPKLASLEYHGQEMPFSFLTPPSLKEALFYFEAPSKVRYEWKTDETSRLHDFFRDLNSFTGLKLLTWTKQEAVMYEDTRVMFDPLQHIKKPFSVKISTCFNDLLTKLLKAWPYPTTLSVKSRCNSEFPKLIYKELKRGEKEPNCCAYFKNKCWRHYLNKVSCEQWAPKSDTESSERDGFQKTVFTLVWNTNKQGRKEEKH